MSDIDHAAEAKALLRYGSSPHLTAMQQDRSVAEAQVNATLALAAEQRTANYLRYLAWLQREDEKPGGLSESAQRRGAYVAQQVRERLGVSEL